MKKTALISFALLLSHSAFAKMSDAQLATAMQKDIEKYMTSLKSEKLIFHWADASDITPQGEYKKVHPPVADYYNKYVSKQGGKVYNQRRSGDSDIAGPGLYMAADPDVSRSYGGEKSFGLIVGVIKPGTKVLASTYGAIKVSSVIQSEITARNCSTDDYLTILDTFDKNCNAVKQLLVGKDIGFASARVYSWGTSFSIPGCAGFNQKRDLAQPTSKVDLGGLNTFVVYNPNFFSKIYGLTNMSKKSKVAEANQILSYLKGLQTEGVNTNLISQAQMNDSDIPAMSKANLEKFAKQNIFGCN